MPAKIGVAMVDDVGAGTVAVVGGAGDSVVVWHHDGVGQWRWREDI